MGSNPTATAIVHSSSLNHARPGGPRSYVDRKLARPAHAHDDGVAAGDVVADQVRPRDEADVRSDELGKLVLLGPASFALT